MLLRFYVSSSWCLGLVCSVWLWHFLVINVLTFCKQEFIAVQAKTCCLLEKVRLYWPLTLCNLSLDVTIFGGILLAILQYWGGYYLTCHNNWEAIICHFAIFAIILLAILYNICKAIICNFTIFGRISNLQNLGGYYLPFHNVLEDFKFTIFEQILLGISQCLGEFQIHNIWEDITWHFTIFGESFAISQYLGRYELPFHNIWEVITCHFTTFGGYYMSFYNIWEDITYLQA